MSIAQNDCKENQEAEVDTGICQLKVHQSDAQAIPPTALRFLELLLGVSKFAVSNLTRTTTHICVTGSVDKYGGQYDDKNGNGNSAIDEKNKHEEDREVLCPLCGNKVHANGHTIASVKHLPLGFMPILLQVIRKRYFCPHCKHSFQESTPFKASHHFITKQLQQWIEDLLSTHLLTISCISKLTHVHSSIIKDIDKHRLQREYRTGKNKNGKVLCCYKKPKHYTRFLGIDEFSLHNHHKYATVIMDLETGEILYVAHGKQKQVVYNFIKLFGDKFMKKVVAVASDMNAGYQAAFKEKYPHLESIYDHFHLVKNFNEGVITKIRNEEYKRLMDEHKTEEAELLKKSKYLLMSSPGKLSEEKEARLEQIFASNKLLYTAEIIKEAIQHAYTLKDIVEMEAVISTVGNLCLETQNSHFTWFANLLQNHLDGIIMHAEYDISTGKVEGTNNKIKTIRRQAYGFRDDEYFFLKILDFTDISHRNV